MFKWLSKAVEDVGNVVGDVVGGLATATTQVPTIPVRLGAALLGQHHINRELDKVADGIFVGTTSLMRSVLQTGTAPARGVLNAADQVTRGNLSGAGDALVNGLIATTPILLGVRAYRNTMEKQAEHRWQRLPEDFIARVQSYYQTDLHHVRYAVVNTLSDNAVTMENDIFYPTEINLDDQTDLRWMLHELEHVDQYRRAGGFEQYILNYTVAGAGEILKHGHFNIHDDIGAEQEADAKANQVINHLMPSRSL